jgi:glycosyltransferase involved in cell wall biosynthesis
MIRVAHFVTSLYPAGLETWLLNLVRNSDPHHVHHDFVVQKPAPDGLEPDFKACGSRILYCSSTPSLAFAARLRTLLAANGPYEVLHSHVHHFSGVVLLIGMLARIPVRIAHCHSDTRLRSRRAPVRRRVYYSLMKRLLRQVATAGLACSRPAAEDLFGEEWTNDSRWAVHYCGIDTAPFLTTSAGDDVRGELGLLPLTKVIGHVGRFTEAKNHEFMMGICQSLLSRRRDVSFVFVGDGELRPRIESRLDTYVRSGRIKFTGVRRDIPRLMTGSFDLLIMPSLHEGLPLVLLEAQAAGLPCLASDSISEEACARPELYSALPLSAGPERWAEEIESILDRLVFSGVRAPAGLPNQSPFDIRWEAAELARLYERLCSANRQS